jgi:hypothetical protein
MSGFKVFSTGQDLDAIFATRTGTDPSAQLVPFVTPAGQNLSERYYPYNPGDTKAIITRFQFFDTSGNIQDLNDYFRKAPGWSGMGSGTTGTVNEISALDASNVYVGGNFLNALDANGNNVPGTSRIAKWDGTSWSALGSGTNNTVTTIYALNASNVYIGGNFTRTDASYNRIARWNANTSTWIPLGNGVNNNVNTIYALDSANVYVGGSFTNAYSNGTTTVSGTTRIAKWNGTAWSRMGTGAPASVNTIYALDSANVYVGGSFANVLDINASSVPGTSRIAKWNGTSWSALGSGTNGTVNTIYAMDSANVYVGGDFTNVLDASGNPIEGTSRIAKWNANTSTWSALGSGITNGFVFVIYALDESNVYVGGTFNSVSSVTGTFCIAKWNANTSTWSALGSGPNDGVYTIDSLNASNVYVGGIFTSAGDASYNRIAIWG